MKKLICIFLFAGIYFPANAQDVVLNTLADDGQEIPFIHNTGMNMQLGIAKCVNDTAYLAWQMTGLTKKGDFILYRSDDGSHFRMIGVKNVFVPPAKSVTYYFRDENHGAGKRYYRIVFINSASEYFMSDKIEIDSSNSSAFPVSMRNNQTR